MTISAKTFTEEALAWEIWSSDGRPIRIENKEKRFEIESGLCSGILLEDDQGIRFAIRSAMIAGAAKHFVASNLSDLSESPRRCFDRLHDVWAKEIGEKEIVSGHVLALLHNSHHIDAFSWGEQAIEAGSDVFDVLHVFEGAIPHFSDASPTSILSFFAAHYEQVKNDLAGGMVFPMLDEWFSRHPQVADEVRQLHEQNSGERSGNVYRSALQGLVLSDFTKGFGLTIDSARSENRYLSGPAIHALGLIDFSERSSALDKAVKVCQDVIECPSHPSFLSAVHTVGRLVPFDERIVDILDQAGQTQNQEALYAISSFLCVNAKGYSARPWFGPLLRLLAATKPSYKGTVSNIDMLLTDWFRDASRRAAIVHFLALWISKQDKSDLEEGVLRVCFPTTIDRLTDQSDLLAETLTRWLLEDDRRFPLAVRTLLFHLRVHRKGPPSLARTVLDGLTNNELRFLVRRILGYLAGDEVLIPLVFSLVYTQDATQRTFGFVGQVLVSYVGYDYPSQTLEYLKTQQSVLDQNNDLKHLCADVIGKIKFRMQTLDALPNLVELRPAFAKVRRFKKRRHHQINEAVEEASKKSIWRQIATHIALKAGTRTFQTIGNRYTDPTELKEISQSVVLPWSEITDPAGAERERRLFRNARRDDP